MIIAGSMSVAGVIGWAVDHKIAISRSVGKGVTCRAIAARSTIVASAATAITGLVIAISISRALCGNHGTDWT